MSGLVSLVQITDPPFVDPSDLNPDGDGEDHLDNIQLNIHKPRSIKVILFKSTPLCLLCQVHSLGGFQAASESDAWSHLSKSLQHNSHLGNELRQIYRYFLLPLEDIVPSKELESRQARYTLEQSRLLELLEAKVNNACEHSFQIMEQKYMSY